jgi:hypothetical protein
VMLADDEALANVDEALRVAERSSDDIALGLARFSMGLTQRDRRCSGGHTAGARRRRRHGQSRPRNPTVGDWP